MGGAAAAEAAASLHVSRASVTVVVLPKSGYRNKKQMQGHAGTRK